MVSSLSASNSRLAVRRRRGVSEVLGALLIIVILVSAAATATYFLTTSQAQAQTRAAYLASVQGDDLRIANAQFSPHTGGGWSSVVMTIRNFDTVSSGLAGISINGSWMQGWEEVDEGGHSLSPKALLGPANDAPPVMISPKSTVIVKLDFTNAIDFPYGYFPSNVATLLVVLESAFGDYFPSVYTPPVAIAAASTLSSDYGGVVRDTAVFDGSRSQAVGTSVRSYSWEIERPTFVGGVCNMSSPATETIVGETIQYPTETTNFSPSANNCVDGPVEAILTVTDQNGFSSTSQQLTIATDPNVDPPGSISAAAPSCTASPCTVSVTVTDILGSPMAGIVVSAVPVYGSVSPTPLSNETDSSGTATFSLAWTSATADVSFITGNLLPAQLSFP